MSTSRPVWRFWPTVRDTNLEFSRIPNHQAKMHTAQSIAERSRLMQFTKNLALIVRQFLLLAQR